MKFKNIIIYLISLIAYLSAISTGDSVSNEEPSHIKQLTDSNFMEMTSKAKPNEKWVIKMYTTYCSACNQLAPIFSQLSQEISELDSTFNFGKINIAENNALSMKFFITRVPTLILLKNGKAFDITEIPRNLESLKGYLLNKEFDGQKPIKGFFNPYGIVGVTFFYLGQMVNYLKTWSKVAPSWILLSIPSILLFVGFYFIFKPPQHVIDRRRPITMPNSSVGGKNSSSSGSGKSKAKKLK